MKILYQAKSVTVSSTLKNNSSIPKGFKNLPFEKIKDDILGKKHQLSLVFIGKCRSRALNSKYRDKNEATDVLSFEISRDLGEIFITPKIAEVKAKKTEMTFGNYLLFLVIHASFHLKGMEHGDKMERYELAHYSRYRHRHL